MTNECGAGIQLIKRWCTEGAKEGATARQSHPAAGRTMRCVQGKHTQSRAAWAPSNLLIKPKHKEKPIVFWGKHVLGRCHCPGQAGARQVRLHGGTKHANLSFAINITQ